MKAADFSYVRPKNIEDALAILADPDADAMPLAGGQSLMPMMNFRIAAPGTLVDLNGISELRGLRVDGNTIRIGAMTRYVDLATSPEIARHVPLIGLALPHIAHAAVRNRGTIGGSVSLADPAAEMPALLLALNAVIHVRGPAGSREIAADDFFVSMYETALEEGELVTQIAIPAAARGAQFGFYELARRHGDYAMAGVAMQIIAGSTCRIAFFSIADRAMRAQQAETALAAGITEATVEQAVSGLGELPFDGDLNATAETKQHLAGVVLKRAIKGLV